MAAAGKAIMAKNLTWGTAGNMSIRIDAGHVLVTGSGTRMDSLAETDFTGIDLATNMHTGCKPSKELPVHEAVYTACSWAGAILHASPPAATLFAISGAPIRNDLFVENMYYLQRIATVPYHHPGHAELAASVASVAATHNVIIMANHGVLIFDTTIEEALIGLEILEQTCRMQLDAAAAGQPLVGLPVKTVSDFLHHSGYKPTRQWLA